jgi:hypothetical protein
MSLVPSLPLLHAACCLPATARRGASSGGGKPAPVGTGLYTIQVVNFYTGKHSACRLESRSLAVLTGRQALGCSLCLQAVFGRVLQGVARELQSRAAAAPLPTALQRAGSVKEVGACLPALCCLPACMSVQLW